MSEEKPTDHYPVLFDTVLTAERRVLFHVVSFGVVFGFWYPWIAVQSGKLLGVSSALPMISAPVATVAFATVASAVFIGCLFLMGVTLRDRIQRFEEPHSRF